MFVSLSPHPDTPSAGDYALMGYVERTPQGGLSLALSVRGLIDGIVLPRFTPPRRADDLWKHTCFEVFLRAEGVAGYVEYNFAPSGAWAAYAFDAYRSGMRDAEIDGPVPIELEISPDVALHLRAQAPVPAPLIGVPWRAAVSAVIEEADGRKSYWALKHPPGKPDFHHADSFALELP